MVILALSTIMTTQVVAVSTKILTSTLLPNAALVEEVTLQEDNFGVVFPWIPNLNWKLK